MLTYGSILYFLLNVLITRPIKWCMYTNPPQASLVLNERKSSIHIGYCHHTMCPMDICIHVYFKMY